MKTPKRESEHRWCPVGETRDYQPTLAAKERARWKRKNRIRQLKATIAVLTRKLRDTERCLAHTQLSPQKVLIIPDHWCNRYTQILKELNEP